MRSARPPRPASACASSRSVPVSSAASATIRGGDAVKLTRMPGVGKKTAERMVLELKDKLAEFAVAAATPRPRHVLEDDVLSALINLGYQTIAAEKALERLGPADGRSFEQLFRAALTELAH